MNIQGEEVRRVYSFQGILSNLMTRVKTLSQLNLPEKVTLQEDVGAIIWDTSEYKCDALLLIPYEGGFLTALVEGLREKWIRPKWYSSETKPQRLKNIAEMSLTSLDRTPLISTAVLGTQVLWLPMVDENQDLIWGSYSLEHGKPSGRHNVIPWFKLTETIPLVVPSSLPTIPDSVDMPLKKLTRSKQKQIPVKLILSVNDDLEVFEVYLSGMSIDERLEYTRTDDLVRFLRYHIRLGSGYSLYGNILSWELQDIDYGDSLMFLKPLVHRSMFYPDEFFYPKTCKEFLYSTTGKEIIMIIGQDGSHYRVELEDLPYGSLLKALEDVAFDIFALGLLTECKELYDARHRVWHPVTLDVTSIMHTSFSRGHEYPRLKEAIDTADESKFDWTKDSWRFVGNLWRNEIIWSIESIRTGQTWRKKIFTFIVSEEQPPQEAIDELREVISALIPLDQVSGVGDRFEDFESTLRERYQSFLEKREEEDIDDVSEEEGGAITLVYQDQTFRHTGLEVQRVGRDKVVVVSLESDEGEMAEVYVVQNVQKYLDDSQYAGSIHSERIYTEVNASLTPYGIADDFLSEIIKEICEVLEVEGVRFYDT